MKREEGDGKENEMKGDDGKSEGKTKVNTAAVYDDGEESAALSDATLIDIVLNFIIAGRDTTAPALSWTLLELMRNSTCLEKSRQEIVREIDRHASSPGTRLSELPQKDAFKLISHNLPYTKATLSEGLRLHPSVPRELKFAVQDDVWPDGTEIEAGMAVQW